MFSTLKIKFNKNSYDKPLYSVHFEKPRSREYIKNTNNKNCSKRKNDNSTMASMCNSLGFFNITSQDLNDHNN